jgi:SAM-dependent methyltransferase
VVGVDASPDQLQVARQRADTLGLKNVTFVEGNAYATGLPRGDFDLAFTRLLLCHLNRPEDGVQEMAALLRAGGVLACEDLDIASLASDPPTAAYDRIRELCIALGVKRGVDYCRGASLHRLFPPLGLAPTATVVQPAFSVGEGKRVWEYTFLEAVPAMLAEGLTTETEVGELTAALAAVAHDPQTLVYHARFVQVAATKR